MLIGCRSMLRIAARHSVCRLSSSDNRPPLSKAVHVPLWVSVTTMLLAATISETFDRRDCAGSAVGRCVSRLSYSSCRA